MNFKLYLFIKVIIGFSKIKVNVIQQITLRIVHRRVDCFRNEIIQIFYIKAEFVILSNSFLLLYINKYLTTYRPHISEFIDPKKCNLFISMNIWMYDVLYS